MPSGFVSTSRFSRTCTSCWTVVELPGVSKNDLQIEAAFLLHGPPLEGSSTPTPYAGVEPDGGRHQSDVRYLTRFNGTFAHLKANGLRKIKSAGIWRVNECNVLVSETGKPRCCRSGARTGVPPSPTLDFG